MKPFILASKSPRRRELIELLDCSFETVSPNTKENMPAAETPEEVAIALALKKVRSVQNDYRDRLILGCDTVVEVDGRLLGKPKNEEDAYAMLCTLSDRTHRVVTGCVLVEGVREKRFFGDAKVTFGKISDNEIRSYIKSEEPFGKAGAYAIQGRAAKFVEHIEGDYYSVMGLPVAQVYRFLKNYENGKLF